MQLGFNCIEQNNVSGLNEFVWFEKFNQNVVTSFAETKQSKASTATNFEALVWFEDIFSDNKMPDVEVQTIAVLETPFGIFDFGMDMSDDLTVDKTNTELPPTTLIKPIVAKENQQN